LVARNDDVSGRALLEKLPQRFHNKWVPVTTAWRVLRLWMEDWPPIWRVAVNVFNKQPRKADKEWSFSLEVRLLVVRTDLVRKQILAPRVWTDPLVRSKQWKRGPLGRPKRRREDNIKMDIQEVGWGMDVIDLAQDRDRWPALVIAVINLRVP
jgi:hypothetical protein